MPNNRARAVLNSRNETVKHADRIRFMTGSSAPLDRVPRINLYTLKVQTSFPVVSINISLHSRALGIHVTLGIRCKCAIIITFMSQRLKNLLLNRNDVYVLSAKA